MAAKTRERLGHPLGRGDTIFLLSAPAAAQISHSRLCLVRSPGPGHDKCLGELMHKEH